MPWLDQSKAYLDGARGAIADVSADRGPFRCDSAALGSLARLIKRLDVGAEFPLNPRGIIFSAGASVLYPGIAEACHELAKGPANPEASTAGHQTRTHWAIAFEAVTEKGVAPPVRTQGRAIPELSGPRLARSHPPPTNHSHGGRGHRQLPPCESALGAPLRPPCPHQSLRIDGDDRRATADARSD